VHLPTEDICRRELEISIPWNEVEKEADRVVSALRRQVRVPGFRPGKVPDKVIRTRYHDDIRKEVVEHLVPRYFWDEAKKGALSPVGAPNVHDVHFHEGESLHFKAEFEVLPDFELVDYHRLEVPFSEPQVNEEEVDKELEQMREQHSSFRNVDPRPLADGDIAVVSLKSGEVEGAPKIDQDETTFTIGAEGTLTEFNENLRGKSPGDEVDFEVTYPEDFGNEKLAGKTIPFHAAVKGIRQKELPELNDDFAADVGDFRTLDELRTRIREALQHNRRHSATEAAKDKLVNQLAEKHDFAVPESLVERQVQSRIERTLRSLQRQGVDLSKLNIDPAKLRESERERAIRDVKAGLLLERIADAESIQATKEEIDAEVKRFAEQSKQSVFQARQKLAEAGDLDRLQSSIRNEKALSFLFDEAVKIDQPAQPEEEAKEEVKSE
jgi:trigger factor